MAYGLQAYGLDADGSTSTYQIDSNRGATRHYAIMTPVAINADTTISSGYSVSDLLWAQPVDGAGDLSAKVSSTAYFQTAAKYAVAKPTSTGLGNTANSDYGLQVNDVNGVLVFDSRKIATGMAILKVIPQWSLAGGRRGVTNNNILV